MKLSLGVLDVAYSDASGDGAKTTGDVAEILEAKYHVMETFYESKKDKIAHELAEGTLGAIETLALRKRRSADPFAEATSKIDKLFRRFLDDDEMSQILPLTQQIVAAQMGVNRRKKAGRNKGYDPRPAFIDTGLFQASFRASVKGD